MHIFTNYGLDYTERKIERNLIWQHKTTQEKMWLMWKINSDQTDNMSKILAK